MPEEAEATATPNERLLVMRRDGGALAAEVDGAAIAAHRGVTRSTATHEAAASSLGRGRRREAPARADAPRPAAPSGRSGRSIGP